MASYTYTQLYGTGSIGENFTSGVEKTFTFTNPSDSSYFTMETIPSSSGFFEGTSPKNFSGSFVTSESMGLVTSSYIASIVVQPGTQVFKFTPAITVTGTTYYLKGTGMYSLDIASTVPVPVNTVAPVASGTNFYVGDVLTTTNGTWSGTPTSFTYQWFNVSSGDNIAGATNNTYTLLIADADIEINCKVFGTNAVGTGQGNSNVIATEFLFAPTNVFEPELSTEGANVGDTISILGNTWDGNPVPTLTYKWYRDGVHQTPHTASTYLTASPDSGKYITLEVIGTNLQGSSSVFSINSCYVN